MWDWSQLARERLLDNSATSWLYGALVFLLTFTLRPLLRRFVHVQRERYAGREAPVILALLAQLIENTSRIVVWIAALFFAEQVVTLPKRVDQLFDNAIIIGLWLQIGIWTVSAARFGLQRQQAHSADPRLSGTMNIVMFLTSLVIWVIAALLALDNLGVNVGPLLAGLGVGGIAIALAVQTVLGDLLASLAIAMDKPFVLGDALRIDTFEGTVEQIGIKSTRLRSISGEQIIISNADLLKSRVRNLGRASERRGLFTLAVAYGTPSDKVEQVPQIVTDAVTSYEGARYVYCLLKELGESGLLFEVSFFVENRPGRDVNNALHHINRRILQGFERTGIRFAHPTRTLWLRREAEQAREKIVAPE